MLCFFLSLRLLQPTSLESCAQFYLLSTRLSSKTMVHWIIISLWPSTREFHALPMHQTSLSCLSHLSQMLMSKNCPLNRNISQKCKCDIIHFWCILRAHSRVIYAWAQWKSCWPNESMVQRVEIWITNKELIHSSMNIGTDDFTSRFFYGVKLRERSWKLATSAKNTSYCSLLTGVDLKCDRQARKVESVCSAVEWASNRGGIRSHQLTFHFCPI